MEQHTINTVIVLRNDQTTNWEDSEYKLLPGEVGIGYLTKTINGKEVTNVIAKLGTDGQTAWKDLPQIEGVFENALTLTHDFGRYKTSNGFVKAEDAVGMTTSQWLVHALSETKEPAITQPKVSFSVSAVTADGKEVGEYITGLKWDGGFTAGTYQYGPADTGVSESNLTWSISNNIDSQTSTKQDGTFTLASDKKIQLTGETGKVYAKITGSYVLDASGAKDPLNNVGATTSGKFINQEDELVKDITVSTFRKPFWGVLTTPLDIEKLTSAEVRALPNTATSEGGVPSSGTEAQTNSTRLNVPVGSRQVIFAIKSGVKSKLVAKDANSQDAVVSFEKLAKHLKVNSANNFDSADYDIWYVQWTDPIKSAKSLKLFWS